MQDEKDLAENNTCPVHLKPCVARKEDNYFFALSKYQHKLEELLARNPDFVRPSHRLNEVRFLFLFLYGFVPIFLWLLNYCTSMQIMVETVDCLYKNADISDGLSTYKVKVLKNEFDISVH